MSLPRVAILAASLALTADALGRAQLLPFGEFAARDGRPGPGQTWKVTDAQGAALATAMNAVVTKTPLVIDYEHQTLTAMQQGHKAPAAGWIKKVEWLSGNGLWADVEWTAPAKAHIAADEYRYISPVITWDDAGNVTGVALAALVNFPGLLGMEPVVAALSAYSPIPANPTESRMEIAALLALLGLAANATDADINAKVTALKAQPALSAALTGALGLAACADEATALSAITTLKSTGGGNAAMVQLVTQLQTQVAALSGQLTDGKVATLVDGAIAAGKFAPALRDTLIAQGKADFTALSSLVAAMPVIPGLAGAGQSGGGQDRDKDNKGQITALSASQAEIAKQLGLSHEAYLKQLNEGRQAAA